MSAPTRPDAPQPEAEPPPTTRSLLMQPGGWRLERRLYTSPLRELAAVIIAVVGALAISALLVVLGGAGVVESFRALYDGAFGTRESALETLVQATPLILTALAAALAFKAGIWNIGGEGQFFAGAMGTWWFADTFGGVRPAPLLFVGMFLAAAIAGGLWASIASVLKALYGTNEILTTVMLNFVILFVLSYLLSGPWRSPDTFYYQTERMDPATFLPRLVSSSRLHWGFVIAIAVAGLVYFLLARTSLGFEIRGLGVNMTAAHYKGTNIGLLIIIVMAMSGAIAGIAGAGELTGPPPQAPARHHGRRRLHGNHHRSGGAAQPDRRGGHRHRIRRPHQRRHGGSGGNGHLRGTGTGHRGRGAHHGARRRGRGSLSDRHGVGR